MIAFDVAGMPAPKGSMRAIVRGRRAILVPGGSDANQRALAAWKQAIQEITRSALGVTDGAPLYVARPLEVHMHFRLPRPKGHYGTGRKAGCLLPGAPHHHIQKPDGDKLSRSVLDALTGLLYDDDARVVSAPPYKAWCHPGSEGCTITVRVLDELTPCNHVVGASNQARLSI